MQRCLDSGDFLFASVGKAAGHDQKKERGQSAANCRIPKEKWKTLSADAVPIIEPKSDITPCESGAGGLVCNAQTSCLDQ